MPGENFKLLNAVVASGNGQGVRIPEGRYLWAVNGDFNGSTVSLEVLGPDGVNYIAAAADTGLTAAKLVPVTLPFGTVRAVVTGGPPNAGGVFATLQRVGF